MAQDVRQSGEGCQDLADLYSVGLLRGEDVARFEAHLVDCDSCRRILGANRAALAALGPKVPPASVTREWVLDFAKAPRVPLDLEACAWDEIVPGVRLHSFCDDDERFVRSQLMWTSPGATRPAHSHLGEEAILVLQGGLIVSGSEYGSGDIVRVRAGWLHNEQSTKQGDCVCFVVHRPAMPGLSTIDREFDKTCGRCRYFSEHRAALEHLIAQSSLA
jgi:hypothetical protein